MTQDQATLSIHLTPNESGPRGSARWVVQVVLRGDAFVIGRGHEGDAEAAFSAASRLAENYKTTVAAVRASIVNEFHGEIISSELLTRLNARLHSLAAILPQLGDAT